MQKGIETWIQQHADYELAWLAVQDVYIQQKPLNAYGQIENVLGLPREIHERLDFVARVMHATFVSHNGLFVAPSHVGEGQLGVYAWIDIESRVELTSYVGRIWSRKEYDLYFANQPELFLRKQRYLFALSDATIVDPTDLEGNLYPPQVSGNLSPYFNEPPFDQAANCVATIAETKEAATSNAYHSDVQKRTHVPGAVLSVRRRTRTFTEAWDRTI